MLYVNSVTISIKISKRESFLKKISRCYYRNRLQINSDYLHSINYHCQITFRLTKKLILNKKLIIWSVFIKIRCVKLVISKLDVL